MDLNLIDIFGLNDKNLNCTDTTLYQHLLRQKRQYLKDNKKSLTTSDIKLSLPKHYKAGGTAIITTCQTPRA